MRFFVGTIIRVLSEQRAQTMSEYAILLVWIVLILIVAATTLGHSLSHVISSTADRV